MPEREPVCAVSGCDHGRRQHGRAGCTDAEACSLRPCTCPVTYTELSPQNPNRKTK